MHINIFYIYIHSGAKIGLQLCVWKIIQLLISNNTRINSLVHSKDKTTLTDPEHIICLEKGFCCENVPHVYTLLFQGKEKPKFYTLQCVFLFSGVIVMFEHIFPLAKGGGVAGSQTLARY